MDAVLPVCLIHAVCSLVLDHSLALNATGVLVLHQLGHQPVEVAGWRYLGQLVTAAEKARWVPAAERVNLKEVVMAE